MHTVRGVREHEWRVGPCRGGGEEGGGNVQCEKVERYYVEEVIRKLKKGEEGEV